MLCTEFFLLGIFIHAVNGLQGTGPCPQIPVVNNLDILKFGAGKWVDYYYSMDDQFLFFNNIKCLERDVSYDPVNNLMSVESCRLLQDSNELMFVKSEASELSPAIFSFLRIDSKDPDDAITFRVVASDSESYGVGFSCVQNSTANKYFAIANIFARPDKLIDSLKLKEATDLFKAAGMSITFLPLDPSSCKGPCSGH